jgi:thiol-disulfide isomerase/thioredoxin
LQHCSIGAADGILSASAMSFTRRHCTSNITLLSLLAATGAVTAVALCGDSRPADLPFKDLSGKKVRLRDYRGKHVVLNFWATWCGPCRDEMPVFVEMEHKYANAGVLFVAASLDDSRTRPKIPEFISKFNIAFPVLTGASMMDLADLSLGRGLPATAFLDKQGRILARVLGQISRDELDQRLEWLTGDRTGPAPAPLVQHLPVGK